MTGEACSLGTSKESDKVLNLCFIAFHFNFKYEAPREVSSSDGGHH